MGQGPRSSAGTREGVHQDPGTPPCSHQHQDRANHQTSGMNDHDVSAAGWIGQQGMNRPWFLSCSPRSARRGAGSTPPPGGSAPPAHQETDGGFPGGRRGAGSSLEAPCSPQRSRPYRAPCVDHRSARVCRSRVQTSRVTRLLFQATQANRESATHLQRERQQQASSQQQQEIVLKIMMPFLLIQQAMIQLIS